MKFCKKCHKRVAREAFTAKDLYNTCVCGDGYLVTESSEVRGFLGAPATRRNRKAKRGLVPTEIPRTEP